MESLANGTRISQQETRIVTLPQHIYQLQAHVSTPIPTENNIQKKRNNIEQQLLNLHQTTNQHNSFDNALKILHRTHTIP